MANYFGETRKLAQESGRLVAEAIALVRSGVMAARRSLEASGLGSNPRGGASNGYLGG